MLNLMKYFKGILVFPFKIFYAIVGFLVLVSLGWIDIKCDPKEAVDDTTGFIKGIFSESSEQESDLRDVMSDHGQSNKIKTVHSRINPTRLIKRPVKSHEIARLENKDEVDLKKIIIRKIKSPQIKCRGCIEEILQSGFLVKCDNIATAPPHDSIVEFLKLDHVDYGYYLVGKANLYDSSAGRVIVELVDTNNAKPSFIHKGDRIAFM